MLSTLLPGYITYFTWAPNLKRIYSTIELNLKTSIDLETYCHWSVRDDRYFGYLVERRIPNYWACQWRGWFGGCDSNALSLNGYILGMECSLYIRPNHYICRTAPKLPDTPLDLKLEAQSFISVSVSSMCRDNLLMSGSKHLSWIGGLETGWVTIS